MEEGWAEDPPPKRAPVDNSDSHNATNRFRFKSKTKGVEDEIKPSRDRHHRHHRRRHHHSSDHRRKRQKTTHAPLTDDARSSENPVRGLPPEQAFRESLFDALGDDEGAAFWEGVYGQPIHNYPDTYQNEETGELERMNEEEYAQFVRRKMWEKSWEGIEAAREEKRREREKEKQKLRDQERSQPSTKSRSFEENSILDFEIEASLQRGKERKDRRRWQKLREDYLRRWEDLRALAESQKETHGDSQQLFLRNIIAWPVESGKRKDVNTEEIERFISRGVPSVEAAGHDRQALINALKIERVRWHPDKIQQRFGFMTIDEGTVRGVTATFQVFDTMWNDLKSKS